MKTRRTYDPRLYIVPPYILDRLAGPVTSLLIDDSITGPAQSISI